MGGRLLQHGLPVAGEPGGSPERFAGSLGPKYPHLGGPGPTIDFLGEAVRWWDRWLKGIDTGVDQDPMLRVWMQDTHSPSAPRRPGHWVAEQEWPSPGIHPRSWTLSPGRIDMEEPCDPDGEMSIQSPLSVGLFAGKWCSYAEATDLAHDQREEDGGALVFDSPVLEEDLEILGAPVAELN